MDENAISLALCYCLHTTETPEQDFLVNTTSRNLAFRQLSTGFNLLSFSAISLNSFCVLCDFGPIARHEKPIFPSSRDSGQMHLFLKLAPLFAGERDWQRAGRAREREESREQKGNDVHTGAAATTT